TLLTEVYGKTGQVEEGLTALAEAQAAVDKTGMRWWEAELYRLKGELTLQQCGVRGSEFGGPNSQSLALTPQAATEAEACFLKAIEIARRQSAKSLELRAVMSLVRLRQHQAQDHATRNTQHDSRILDHASRPTHHETRLRLDAARNTL